MNASVTPNRYRRGPDHEHRHKRLDKTVLLGVAEPFITTMTVSLYAGLLLALPLILYELYAFLLPAFKPEERRLAMTIMGLVPALFAAGVIFGYFIALPRAVDFLQNFNDDAFDILIQAKDYYRFTLLFLLMTGLVFQIPVAILAVTRLGIVSNGGAAGQPRLRAAGDGGHSGHHHPHARPRDDADHDGADGDPRSSGPSWTGRARPARPRRPGPEPGGRGRPRSPAR